MRKLFVRPGQTAFQVEFPNLKAEKRSVVGALHCSPNSVKIVTEDEFEELKNDERFFDLGEVKEKKKPEVPKLEKEKVAKKGKQKKEEK